MIKTPPSDFTIMVATTTAPLVRRKHRPEWHPPASTAVISQKSQNSSTSDTQLAARMPILAQLEAMPKAQHVVASQVCCLYPTHLHTQARCLLRDA